MSRPLSPRAPADAPSPALWELLTDAVTSPDAKALRYFIFPEELAENWQIWREAILRDWARLRPGTRPSLWWKYDAPEPRRRLGGVGTPACECLAYEPRFEHGVLADWIDAGDVAAYDEIGDPLGVSAIDPADPPTYESEAAFLDRHKLLLPGERRRLRPADFEPVSVLGILDGEDD